MAENVKRSSDRSLPLPVPAPHSGLVARNFLWNLLRNIPLCGSIKRPISDILGRVRRAIRGTLTSSMSMPPKQSMEVAKTEAEPEEVVLQNMSLPVSSLGDRVAQDIAPDEPSEEINIPPTPNCVKAGTTLMECDPFAVVTTEENRLTHCSFCFASGLPETGLCCKCLEVKYCDCNCQMLDWEAGHKFECKGLEKLGSTNAHISSYARLIIRLLTKLQNKDIEHGEQISFDIYRTFEQLISHAEELKSDPVILVGIETIRKAVVQLVAGVKGIRIPEGDEFIELYGKLSINGFTIHDERYTQLGSALYIGASVFNHACRPTAIASFQNTKIIIRNLVDLPSDFPIELVTVNYMDPVKPTSCRKADLRESYYFECECEWCREGLDAPDMISVGCEFCLEQLTLSVDKRCPHCSRKLSKEFQKKVESIDDSAKSLIKLTENGLAVPHGVNLETLVRSMLEIRYSPTHWLLIKMCDYASDVHMANGQYSTALEFAELELVGLRRYFHPNHGIIGYRLVKAAELAWLLKMKPTAKNYIISAEPSLRITHGETSKFYQEFGRIIVDELISNQTDSDNSSLGEEFSLEPSNNENVDSIDRASKAQFPSGSNQAKNADELRDEQQEGQLSRNSNDATTDGARDIETSKVASGGTSSESFGRKENEEAQKAENETNEQISDSEESDAATEISSDSEVDLSYEGRMNSCGKESDHQ